MISPFANDYALDCPEDDGVSSAPEMEWATQQFSRGQVDRAGELFARFEGSSVDDVEHTFEVINNWRAIHNFPLNTFQVTLRRKASAVDDRAIVAQRIKRLSSIGLKLRLLKTLKLSQMQDIGGCRAIVRNTTRVKRLVREYESGDLKHELADKDDYISSPKSSGYRGVHLIYRYFSDRKATYNGLKIEMQIRSKLQHAWATAVETVGTFTDQALKSSQGGQEWLRFFALMSSANANVERSPIVPGTPERRSELRRELRELARALEVERRLAAYGKTLRTLEAPDAKLAHYFLLALNPTENTVSVTGYRANESERATMDFMAVERKFPDVRSDAVLVSVESLSALRRAYPNYFLDTSAFIEALKTAIA
jgi:hypothetical protein